MTAFVAFLRAVNVGGTGKLPMRDLKRVCEEAGFDGVRTHGVSGNAIFESTATEAEVADRLAAGLQALLGQPVGVLVRTVEELAAVLAAHPFPDAEPSRTLVLFLAARATAEMLVDVRGRSTEALRVGTRELYVHYPDGIGRSRLQIPAAGSGTARNINTLTAVVRIAAPTP